MTNDISVIRVLNLNPIVIEVIVNINDKIYYPDGNYIGNIFAIEKNYSPKIMAHKDEKVILKINVLIDHKLRVGQFLSVM
jgi:hypothetical protein